MITLITWAIRASFLYLPTYLHRLFSSGLPPLNYNTHIFGWTQGLGTNIRLVTIQGYIVGERQSSVRYQGKNREELRQQ
jgi:hypothetical protein